ncbi:2-dehydro-3-deoxyphosphogluconate aldolase [candidate division KSB3 bacterium]|uniref:2-dehydro-3-deoxy-phosphogluconate aldolase n=1 Tax=candidate division KSB3 bacterium TaxID=2044937 RepID=A0A2G6EFQ8_9BACT|nr:MAG: 2-dehydro-3-deoxyphosphogluconate aldolase [candidate division KSB3 bacterium]PIE31119.1 MAG: 2-dehydro-3-deoxyphosphogluconate aldolase [candidate division KSB3 bacterium]
MNKVLEKIAEFGLLPVVKIDNADHALPLGQALLAGGLPVAEITFRTAAAEAAISRLHKDLPEVFLGAGTVLTVEQAEKAVNAGASFIVSPGLNPRVVKYCVDNHIPMTPGVNSPSQIETALEFGLDVVKFFPAEASGGLKMLKAMAAPYGAVKFIPTGGINQDNMNSYLACDKILACGGSWMVKADLISSGRFDEITRLTRAAVTAMLGFEFAQLGISEASSEKALHEAKQLSELFSFPFRDGTSSVFSGSAFEVVKRKYPGTRGHVAIAVNHLERAVAYLQRQGIKMLPETATRQHGKLTAIYLDTHISGFAIHLLQK